VQISGENVKNGGENKLHHAHDGFGDAYRGGYGADDGFGDAYRGAAVLLAETILIGLFVPCICFCPVDTSMDPYCGLGCVWLCGPRDPNGCCC
jgi:hypothetical protein